MGWWCSSSSVCHVEWRWCVLLLSRTVQCVWPVPHSSRCSAVEYCCRVVCCCLPGGVVCGCACPSALLVRWGILCVPPPSLWWWWGHCGWWGGIVVVGGMTREGRVCCGYPVCVLASPYRECWRPSHVCAVAVLNGGVCRCVVPVFVLSPFSSWCFLSCVVLPLFCLVCGGVCCVASSRIGLGVLYCPAPSCIALLFGVLLSHHLLV